jgi:DNA recombination protein RmuC
MPEVVVMFVPVEASVSAAFLADRDLFEDAFQNKVLITSPISLFALLKAVAFGWQQQQVTDNAEKIATQGKSVYDRLMTFAAHFSGIGKSLEASVKKYNEASGSMETRVLPAVRRLKELGVGSEEIEAVHQIESNVVRLPESRSD